MRAWKSTGGFSDCDGLRASSAVFARGAVVVVRLIPEKMPKRVNCRRVRSVRSCLQPNKTIVITSARLRQSVEHALELVSRVPLLQLPLYICKINGHSFLLKFASHSFYLRRMRPTRREAARRRTRPESAGWLAETLHLPAPRASRLFRRLAAGSVARLWRHEQKGLK